MYVYNPKNFDPCLFLSHEKADLARLFISILLSKARDEASWIPLSAHIFRKQIPNRKPESIREVLIDQKVIECDKTFCPGSKCYNYRLTEKYRGQQIIPIAITNKHILRNEAKQIKSVLDNPAHKRIVYWLEQVKIEYNDAVNLLEKTKTKNKSLKYLTLERIKAKDWFFGVDERGRVYHNVACIWSAFRQFLSINNNKLVNIDIANSQPLLFSIKIKEYLYHYSIYNSVVTDIKDDGLHSYFNLVQQGNLYDYLMKEFNISEKKRRSFKKKFFAEVFYSKNDYESTLTKGFEKLFPAVFNVIRHYKQDDHRALPLSMQKIEAEIMINDVCTKLADTDIPFLTIHDSILTTQAHVEDVKVFIQQAFAKRDLSLTFK